MEIVSPLAPENPGTPPPPSRRGAVQWTPSWDETSQRSPGGVLNGCLLFPVENDPRDPVPGGEPEAR